MESNLLPFLQEKCQAGDISEHHIADMLACIEAGAPINDVLGQYWTDFLIFKENLARANLVDRTQQVIVSKRLIKINKQISALITEISTKEEPLVEPRQTLEFWTDRCRLFPENPRFQKEVSVLQAKWSPYETEVSSMKIQLKRLNKEKDRLHKLLAETVDRESTVAADAGIVSQDADADDPIAQWKASIGVE